MTTIDPLMADLLETQQQVEALRQQKQDLVARFFAQLQQNQNNKDTENGRT